MRCILPITKVSGWLLVGMMGMVPITQSEEVTVTTYYPSPRGNYQTLSTTSSTTLATDPTESVVIGITPSATTKLDVRGRLQLRDGTEFPGWILQTDVDGMASWVDPNTLFGIVTGSGTPNVIPYWDTPTHLADSVIQQFSLNIGIGGPPGPYKLDVAGSAQISGTLSLPGLICPGKLFVNLLGVVSCGTDLVDDADNVIGNELTGITPGAGITVIGGLPSPTVALANPIKICTTPGEFMTSFDLGSVLPPTCAAPLASGPGGSTSQLLAGANITINGIAGGSWNPGTDPDAIIAASVAASGLPSGSNGDTLRNSGGGTNWIANSTLYNNGTNTGIGTTTPTASVALTIGSSGTTFPLRALPTTTVTTIGYVAALVDAGAGTVGIAPGFGLSGPPYRMWFNNGEGIYALDGGWRSPVLGSSGSEESTWFPGDVGIGTTTPGAKFEVVGTAKITGDLSAINSGATYALYGENGSAGGWGLYCNGGASGACGGNKPWANISDARLKTGIAEIPHPLESVMALRGVAFSMKDGDGQREIGFLAQEVDEALPGLGLVAKTPDDYYALKMSNITALLVEAVKEQQRQIQELRSESEELERRLHRLESE